MHVLKKANPAEIEEHKAQQKTAKKAKEPIAPQEEAAAAMDALDTFEKADAWRVLQLIYWKRRHQDPSFTLEITEADIKGFDDCIAYLGVEPHVNIVRPRGLPAQDAIPATAKRSAIPSRAAKPPQNYVVIQMVDTDGNAITPIENNEDDYAEATEAKRLKRIRDTAPMLATQLLQDLAANTTSSSTIQDAAAALKELAK